MRSQRSHAVIWIPCKKINASSFLAPTTFGAEYRLHLYFGQNLPTLQRGLRAIAQLLVFILRYCGTHIQHSTVMMFSYPGLEAIISALMSVEGKVTLSSRRMTLRVSIPLDADNCTVWKVCLPGGRVPTPEINTCLIVSEAMRQIGVRLY